MWIEILEPYLTCENHAELIAASRHKTKREVEKLIRDREPLADVPATIRKLPAIGGERVIQAALLSAATEAGTANVATILVEAAALNVKYDASPASHRSVVAPLAPARYKVQFTASELLHDKLLLAQSLLRHRIPDGDVAQIFELALVTLVEKLEKQKLAATDRPRQNRRKEMGLRQNRPTATTSRTIPAAVKRAVWRRDGGQCAFIGKSGCRCSEIGFLEFHHVVAFAHGGAATVENIALRCRSHNQYEARLEFGRHEERSRDPGDIVRELPAAWDVSVT